MDSGLPNDTERSEFRSTQQMPWHWRNAVLKGFLSASSYDLDKELAWHYGMEFLGASFAKTNEGWRVVLKGRKRKAQMVAFVEAPTWPDVLDRLHFDIAVEVLRWYPDRYANVTP